VLWKLDAERLSVVTELEARGGRITDLCTTYVNL
jgi:hypothetical protein